MRTTFTRESFHKTLLADVFPRGLGESGAMLVFALFHTHRINVVNAAISDAPELRHFAAITQRHCAECLAYLWRETDDDRANYAYWYWKWNKEWSYERVESLVDSELRRFGEIKRRIEEHRVVTSIEPEDD